MLDKTKWAPKPPPEPVITGSLAPQPKKRGRKPKIEFDPRQYDPNYITLWEDIVDNQKVLVDIKNNVYKCLLYL